MIIDFHTHIFPDKIAGATIEKLSKASDSPAYTDGTKDGLKRSMEESGVDISVVLPVVTKPQQFSSINRYAREITRKSSAAAVSFSPLAASIRTRRIIRQRWTRSRIWV
ncbi:hypothetical protein LC724_36370 [Blautia sp. RD014234]|nr:hypothetical protein [Blautia parvula]